MYSIGGDLGGLGRPHLHREEFQLLAGHDLIRRCLTWLQPVTSSGVDKMGGSGVHVQRHAGQRQGGRSITPLGLKVSGVGHNSTPLLL